MFGSNLKDIVTTIAGIVQAVAVAVQQAIAAANGAPINWTLVILSAAIAVASYFNGKNADGSAKTAKQVDAQLLNK